MKLSRRLQEIEDWIDQEVIADIGCDHGKLCCKAVLDGKAKKAYACDINEGPLSSARKLILETGLQDRVFLRLQNGFENLEEDVELIIVAGMGAENIIEMLEKHPVKTHLLLSPHKDPEILRDWLQLNHWKILREKLVHDGHFYPVLYVVPGEMKKDPVSALYGYNPQVDEDYRAYLKFQETKLNKILDRVPETKQKKIQNQLALLNQRKTEIEINGK